MRLRQGFSWLAGVTPSHALALTVCASALLLGVAVADDYGIWVDTYIQRTIGEATLRHLAGERNGLNLLWPPWSRLYGPIFVTPLALVERLLGLDDSRHILFSRHLLTHLFFIVAGFAGYLLAWRLFGNRWLALFALLLFLLHPRIYAHSFFNTKDAPFLALFMICLWLAHRAFDLPGAANERAGGAVNGGAIYGAFALCGVAAGLLTNLRVMGLAFVAVVVFMRLCDAVGAETWRQRRRAVASCAAFALAAAGAYYATMPYLWADPLTRFVEILQVLSSHPTDMPQLFQGKFVFASELPPSYLPVWFGITTPPLALLFGAVGLAVLVYRFALRPFTSLSRNTPLRFELLIAACFLPVLTTVVLQPITYGGWRHFYFLWAPFVLLATSGLRALAWGLGNGSRSIPRSRLATAVGLAALGLAATAVELARLHPHQHLYFNVLANRPATAQPVWRRFQLGETFGIQHAYAHVLQELADHGDHADALINIHPHASKWRQRRYALLGVARPYGGTELLEDQWRFKFDANADVDFFVADHGGTLHGDIFAPLLYERKLYGQPIVRVATPDLSRVDESTAQSYRALYREITSNAPTLRHPRGDVYRGETAVFWVWRPCPPGGVNGRKRMVVVPLDAARDRINVPPPSGVRVGDACLWGLPLPDIPFAKLIFPRVGVLASDAYLEERRRRYARLEATFPSARSTFDIYLQGGTLFYVKSPCVQEDTAAPFFLHVIPRNVGDLPRSRQRHGFEALDFRFGGLDMRWQSAMGDIFDGICMVARKLPDYPIAKITTGQWVSDGGSLWQVEIVTDG